MEKRRRWFWCFWSLMFVGAFVIMCFNGYSDGDDAFFYEYTHSMGFLEYLGWRYETWVGRMAAEALVYITFRLGLWFWRVVNALMLLLLPLGVLTLAAKAARVPEGSMSDWHKKKPACGTLRYEEMGPGAAVAAVAGYFLMGAMTLGYAAVWVNGSIFYTWSFACGIWGLMPFADFVFSTEDAAEKAAGRLCAGMDRINGKKFFYSLPCAVVASMSIEQMGAVLLVFEALGVLYGIWKWRRIHPLLLAQALLTAAAFGILFAAPGNDLRVAAEIVTWMPEYGSLTLGHHLFITVHWMLSSFANENRLFLCGIWIVGILLVAQKEKRAVLDIVFAAAAALFTAAALLPYAGIDVLSDFGLQYLNLTGCIEQVPTVSHLDDRMLFACFWWAAALTFTFVFLFRVSACQVTLLLAYLAGIASEAIMYFSPTMYASGARVYYLTDILYLFVILCLVFGLREARWRRWMYGLLAAGGIANFVYQIPVFLEQL